jgi:hypothetical protein
MRTLLPLMVMCTATHMTRATIMTLLTIRQKTCRCALSMLLPMACMRIILTILFPLGTVSRSC